MRAIHMAVGGLLLAGLSVSGCSVLGGFNGPGAAADAGEADPQPEPEPIEPEPAVDLDDPNAELHDAGGPPAEPPLWNGRCRSDAGVEIACT